MALLNWNGWVLRQSIEKPHKLKITPDRCHEGQGAVRRHYQDLTWSQTGSYRKQSWKSRRQITINIPRQGVQKMTDETFILHNEENLTIDLHSQHSFPGGQIARWCWMTALRQPEPNELVWGINQGQKLSWLDHVGSDCLRDVIQCHLGRLPAR